MWFWWQAYSGQVSVPHEMQIMILMKRNAHKLYRTLLLNARKEHITLMLLWWHAYSGQVSVPYEMHIVIAIEKKKARNAQNLRGTLLLNANKEKKYINV
jgi:hypothetical protein